MNKTNFGKALSAAWAVEKANLVLMIVGMILAGLVSNVTCGICGAAAMAGLMAVGLRLLDADPKKPEIGDVFCCLKYTLPALVLLIVGQLGCLACGVGSLVTVPLAILAIIRMADTGNTESCGIAALKEVIAQIKAKGDWLVIVWMLVAGIVAALGVIVCFVGLFVTIPLAYLTMAALYRQLFPKAEAPAPAPETAA